VAACLAGSGFLLAPGAASAQRAEYANESELPPEGMPHVLDVATAGQYSRVLSPDHVSGLTNLGAFDLRTRLDLGRTLTYAAGLDGEIGGSDRGFVYGATLYPVGVGARWGASTLALRGGIGFDGVADAVPLAMRVPAELSVAVSLGPVRPILWASPAWVAGADSRRHGSSISAVDELELGLLLRLSPEHRYWADLRAGGGLALGFVYRELMGTRVVSAVLGFDFVGAP